MWTPTLDARQRHPLLFFLVVLATHFLLHARAGGDPIVDDPARGPYDDRVAAPPVDWTVSAGENAVATTPVVAGALSGVGTVAGLAMLTFAVAEERTALATGGALTIAIGPSLGHWYAGRAWNPGLASRLGTGLIAGTGVLLVTSCSDTARSCTVGSDSILVGAAGYVASTIYEIVSAPAAAREGTARAMRIVVVPLRGQLQIVPGVALATRF